MYHFQFARSAHGLLRFARNDEGLARNDENRIVIASRNAAKQSSRERPSHWIASLGNVPLARNDEGLARNDGGLANSIYYPRKSASIRVICG
jgi:hypothetical protein